MHSSLIGKIQKAHVYAQEPDRVEVREFSGHFRGDHDTYQISFANDRWSCSCSFFPQWHVCSHVMAIQKMLGITPVEPEVESASAALA